MSGEGQELSDLARKHSAPSVVKSILGVGSLVFAVGFSVGVYYGLILPTQQLYADTNFCLRTEIANYRRLVVGGNVANLMTLHAPQTGQTCAEIYRRMNPELEE